MDLDLDLELSCKSDKVSADIRGEGNGSYQDGEYKDALQFYNVALTYAMKQESMEASMALANRSSVYLTLKLYDKCLENIKMAREAGYPADKIQILNDREKKCLEMMKMDEPKKRGEEEAKNFFKLSYPAHEKIPFLVNCVELRETDKYGRGLYATRDLKTGDVIAITEPLMTGINKNAIYSRCSHCLKSNCLSLLACPFCVSTMYCSKECLNDALMKYHELECCSIDDFREFCEEEDHPEYDILPILWKLFFEGQHAVGGLKKLIAACSDDEIAKKTFFDYDLRKENNPALERNQFLSALGHFSTLSKNGKVGPSNRLQEKWINIEPLRSMWNNSEEKKTLKMVLVKLHAIIANPFFREVSKSNYELDPVSRIYGDIFSSVNLLFNYINHSCVPNVTFVAMGIKSAFVISKPIKKDQQIFISYGPSFESAEKAQRQKYLKETYDIDCDCVACANDWTKSYVIVDDGSGKMFKNSIGVNASDEPAKALNTFHKCSKYIEENHHLLPNMNLMMASNLNVVILNELARNAATFGETYERIE